MARSFKSLVEEVSQSWDEDTQKLYTEAGHYFEFQIEQQNLRPETKTL